MTVQTQTTKVVASGNGTATVFSFSPLVIFESTDLQVVFVDSDGVESTLTEGTGTANYSVSVSEYPGTGSITYPASGSDKLASGESLVMKRVLTIEQTTDLENQGGYFADTQEAALDRLTMVDLQQQELIDRSLKFPVSDTDAPMDLPAAADRAGKVLAFDDDGQPTASTVETGALVSSVMEPVVGAATLATAREELGATAVGEAVFTAASAAAARTATGAAAEATSGWHLLATKTASASAAIDFTASIDSTYDEYLITITDLIPATDNVELWLRVAEDTTPTIKSGASDYKHSRFGSTEGATVAAAGSAGDTKILLVGGVGTGTGEGCSAEIRFSSPSGARYKAFRGQVAYLDQTPSFTLTHFSGLYKGTVNAIQSVRLLMSSGNITSGSFRLYGLKK